MISLLLGLNLHVAEATPLSLQDSLSLVATQNPEVQIARLQADQSNLERLKVLTSVVSVQASGSWLDFGEPLDSYILGDENTEVDCSSFEAFGFGDLCASFSEPLRVRDDRIFDGSIQVALPVSALYSIVQGHTANQHLQNIKELETEQTKQRIELSVIDIYLQALELQAQAKILNDTIHRLEKHQQSVRAFVAQGLAHPVQELELAHAIKQTTVGIRQVNQGYQLLCQQMELLLGLSESFEPIEIQDTILPPTEGSPNDSLSYKIAQQQYQAAQAGSQAALGNMIPTIALMAATTSTQGQGPFTPTSQQYIGLSVQGDLAWGQKWMTYKQRQLDVTIAKQGLDLQQRALSLQQKQSKQAWEQAQEQIELAQEKIQIEQIKRDQAQVQFDNHQITTTDLLEAEAAFSEAQVTLLKVKHQHIVAQAKYQQSLNADTLYFAN